jgi:hypothetical protein
VVPKIRIGQRWINVLWSLPVGFVLIVIGVAVAQALRSDHQRPRKWRIASVPAFRACSHARLLSAPT